MSEQELTAQQIKEAIIKAKMDRPKEPVEQVEILGIKGWLFKGSSYEINGWRKYENSKDDDIQRCSMARLVQISFRDKQGNVVFGEKDVTIIAGIDDDVIYPVYRSALRINGMSVEGLESILKNLLVILGVDGLYGLLASMGAPCPNCLKDTKSTSSESSG